MTYIKNSLIYLFLWLLPKNMTSRLIGALAGLRLPVGLSRLVNNCFVKTFKLNMSEAERPLNDYRSLQELFTRRLKPGVRVIDKRKDLVVSPCDGFMSQLGPIRNGLLLQVKGKNYAVADLLGSASLAARFTQGYYATIYLSPRDYHRFHVPLDGTIIETIYIPGSLWPVNKWAVANIKNLFCQNERIISLIKPTHSAKIIAHVAVGATNVGKIKLAYGEFTSNLGAGPTKNTHELPVERGQDLGEFKFGSTIIMLFESKLIHGLIPHAPCQVKVGQALAWLANTSE